MTINVTETPRGIMISGLPPKNAKEIHDKVDRSREELNNALKTIKGKGSFPNLHFQLDDNYKLTVTGSVKNRREFTQCEDNMKRLRDDQMKETREGVKKDPLMNPSPDGRTERRNQSSKKRKSPLKKKSKKKRSRKH